MLVRRRKLTPEEIAERDKQVYIKNKDIDKPERPIFHPKKRAEAVKVKDSELRKMYSDMYAGIQALLDSQKQTNETLSKLVKTDETVHEEVKSEEEIKPDEKPELEKEISI